MNSADQIIFQEKQSFPRFWFYLFFLLFLGCLFVGFQSERIDIGGIRISITVLGILSALFLLSKLETVISHDEIQYRLFPFHWRLRKITKDQIAEVFVRKYNPIFEYGGWGLRWSLNGKAINIRGNMGIQLVLKSGSRILIGTSNAKEAAKALEKFTEHPPAS